MSNINKYLPLYLQDIIELNLINESLDFELENIFNEVDNIYKEVIINTSSVIGISKWENSLGLPNYNNNNLELRRFRVSNILNNKLPYTEEWLINKLKEITNSENGFTLSIDNNAYIITIVLTGLDPLLMNEVENQLRYSIPANMELLIGGEAISGSDIKIGIGTYLVSKYQFRS